MGNPGQMPDRSVRGIVGSVLAGCVVLLLWLDVPVSALAQAGPANSNMPNNGFYLGLGGGYDWLNFGTQNVFAVGTFSVFQAGTLVSTGSAAGPGIVNMKSQSAFSPVVQVGYFQNLPGGNWLWGARFQYNHPGASSTDHNVLVPQAGSFTDTGNATPVPFTGNAFVRSYQTSLEHQMALTPFIGHSFVNGFVYIGAGPTLARTRTNLNDLIGFADINGRPTDVSGRPVNFSSSGWVWGGAAVVGATYFFAPSWFLDFAYTQRCSTLSSWVGESEMPHADANRRWVAA